MSEKTQRLIIQAEADLKAAEVEFGLQSMQVADRLISYARLLKEAKVRLLDAANMEARARAIHESTPSDQRSAPNGIGGIQTGERTCPFCAEVIKSAAVKCKHCGSDLSKALPRHFELPTSGLASKSKTWLAVAGIALTITGVVVLIESPSLHKSTSASAIATIPQTTDTSNMQLPGQVNGAAWLTNESGASNIQRGLQVYLCKLDLNTQLHDIENAMKSCDIAIPATVESGLHNILTRRIMKLVTPYVVAESKCDVDGKFGFSNVSPGSYYIVAHNRTALYYALWIQRIEVHGAEATRSDLDNSNVTVNNTDMAPHPFMTLNRLKWMEILLREEAGDTEGARRLMLKKTD